MSSITIDFEGCKFVYVANESECASLFSEFTGRCMAELTKKAEPREDSTE